MESNLSWVGQARRQESRDHWRRQRGRAGGGDSIRARGGGCPHCLSRRARRRKGHTAPRRGSRAQGRAPRRRYSVPAHCRKIIENRMRKLGGIDILVNNAAHQASFKSIEDISDEEWELTFRVNIHAMFHLTKAAVPHMKPGSTIINTASINADAPSPTLLAYATTKGARFRISRRGWCNFLRTKAFARTRSRLARSGPRSSLRRCRKRLSRISAARCR